MVELKCNKEVAFTVSDWDLDAFINATFRFPNNLYNFVPNEEVGNDSSTRFTVTAETFDKYDWEKVKKMQQGKFQHFITQPLLNEACFLGLIEPGVYNILVSW